MKSLLCVSVAITLYSISNVLIEQRLAKVNPLVIMAFSYPIFLTFVAVGMVGYKMSDQPLMEVPWYTIVGVMILNALVWFFAEFLYLGSYTLGGDALLITTVAALLPVITAAVRYFWIKQPPTLYHFAGWTLALVAVFLVMKGESLLRSGN